MFPLGTVLFPSLFLPLHVFEARYRAPCAAVYRPATGEFGVVLIERGNEVGGGDVRTSIGTMARIVEARASSMTAGGCSAPSVRDGSECRSGSTTTRSRAPKPRTGTTSLRRSRSTARLATRGPRCAVFWRSPLSSAIRAVDSTVELSDDPVARLAPDLGRGSTRARGPTAVAGPPGPAAAARAPRRVAPRRRGGSSCPAGDGLARLRGQELLTTIVGPRPAERRGDSCPNRRNPSPRS